MCHSNQRTNVMWNTAFLARQSAQSIRVGLAQPILCQLFRWFAALLSCSSDSPIQAPVLNRLGDVRGLNVFGAREVGDGAAYFKHPAVGAGA